MTTLPLKAHTIKKQQTKLKHVEACLLPSSQYKKSAGFAEVALSHNSTAGLCLEEISLETTFLSHKLKAPLMIAPMTGGMELGAILNRRWALAAEYFELPFGVGSQRLALMDDRVRPSFIVRNYAPHAFIFANLGAGQLIKHGASQAIRAVDMIRANALFIHLNPLQEVCQEGGDVDFRHVIKTIAVVVQELHKLSIPVLVREVGFGLSEQAAKDLIDIGVAGLDCAGAGGTSWTKVEALCATSPKYRAIALAFGEWGIPTVQSILNVRKINSDIPLIATGGIRNGLDVAKALALKANIASMAQPMLQAAIKGEAELFSLIEQVLLELRIAMFACGAKNIHELQIANK